MNMNIENRMISISYYSNNEDTQIILSYIYDNLKDIEGECISSVKRMENNDFEKRKQDDIFIHKIIPVNGIYKIDNIDIQISDFVLNDFNIDKINYYVIKVLKLTSNSKDNILKFVEKAIKIKEKESEEKLKNKFINKIEKKRYLYFDWVFDTLIPKRSFNNIFLKEGQIEKIYEALSAFTNKNSYHDYVKHGIPYKINILLHGKPGVGKTSLIHAIASLCDACICNLNINSELTENDMIRAVTAASNIEKTSILVIEDIDCIFTDEKDGDCIKNKITMNGLLNCLDGFNNPEGLIVIMTTNYPNKLDSALVRSGRIDLDIELTYLDKYQAKNMYKSFFKDDAVFEEMWANINKYNIEPSTLMQFLFNNRKSNIREKLHELYNILDKKHYSQNNKNIYM